MLNRLKLKIKAALRRWLGIDKLESNVARLDKRTQAFMAVDYGYHEETVVVLVHGNRMVSIDRFPRGVPFQTIRDRVREMADHWAVPPERIAEDAPHYRPQISKRW